MNENIGKDNFIIPSAQILLNVLKELPFNEVKLNFINEGMAKTCINFLNRKDTTPEGRDIFLDILVHLTLCFPGHRKLYQDGVYEFLEQKVKDIMKKGNLKNNKDKNDPQAKEDMKYLEMACNIANDTEMAPELIQTGLMEHVLQIFNDDGYPDVLYKKSIKSIAAFSKSEVGRTYLRNSDFDLKRFVLKFDKIDSAKVRKAGVAVVKSLADEHDLDIALKGLEDLNDADITLMSYLAMCENLIPIMVEKDIVKKILDTLDKLLARKDRGEKVDERAIKNLTKVLTTVCKRNDSCLDKFLQLDGFKTVSGLLDLKNIEINTGLLPFIAMATEKGPSSVVSTMQKKLIPRKLALFWEETPPLIEEMKKGYISIKNFKETVVETNDPHSEKQKVALENYKKMKDIMESGFYLFDKLSEKDPKMFAEVSPKFHYANACNLKEFTESKSGQNQGLQFMAKLDYTAEASRELLKGGFVNTSFEVKLNNTNWNKYGLNCERV